ncbi:glycosyltransferase family 1 protein [Butyrivibrio sp. MC2021]|uniref:glycosyltransferase family 1 protein n=1 Tax=Butyrivibrio sp. MC2021 TaxID=1408306 RepID=UPI000478D0C4|nr:glycosyltransferase family 1 protein [Butyrivibrio sp. MC2021]
MKKIKILILSTSGFTKKEGISTVILDYFARFDKETFEPHIVVSGDYDKKLVNCFEQNGIRIHFLHSRKKYLFLYVKELFFEFRKERYDVVYVHGSSAIMSIELFVAKLSGCKVRVAHSHNTTCDHKRFDKMLRPIFNRLYTDAFACGTEAGRWLFSNKDFILIRNGRDVNKYAFDENMRRKIRSELGVDENCLLIGHVGNFNNQKNHQFALNVFKEVLEKKKNAKLYFMGTGALLDDMKRLANEIGISKDVVFMGSIDNVEEMLQAMDVMILPSLHEGLPLVVVEWQIAALPSLVSDNVTKEVSFSNLVHFMSLEKEYSNWAEKIIEISKFERNRAANEVIRLAQKSGFDIDEDVKCLQDHLMKKVLMEH